MFDINILPPRYRRKRLTLLMVLPWLLLLILLGTIYPTYIMAVQTQDAFREQRLAVAQTQVKLDFFQVSNEELESLQKQIEERTIEQDLILDSYSGLNLDPEVWSSPLYQIESAVPPGVVLSYLSRQGNAYRIEGISAQYQRVIDFKDALAGNPSLAEVEIDLIERIDEDEAPLLPSLPPPSGEDGEDAGPPALVYYSFTILFHSSLEVQP